MLKQLRAETGSGVGLWDEHWRKYDAVQYDAGSLRWDGILDLVDRRLGSGPLLEAGCGLGKYVLYAASRDADMVGIDFVRQAVAKIRMHRADAKVAVADLARLPFPSASFATILCLGVLEHFEEGADDHVAELVRVLRPGGWLIATVPYANLLKRRRARRNSGDVVSSDASVPSGATFYQYCYSRHEARRLLERGGLEIVHDRRISRLFWLMGRRSPTTATRRPSSAPSSISSSTSLSAAGSTAGSTRPGASTARRLARELAYHGQHLIPSDWTSHMIAIVGRKPAAPACDGGAR